MKFRVYILMFAFLMIFVSCSGQQKANEDEITWLTNMEEAFEQAAEKDVPVFVHFTGSDWCKWCHKLEDEVYDKKVFQDYVEDNLVMVKLDFPRNIDQSDEVKMYNRSQLQKYGVRGFPTVLLLAASGREIGRTGYQYGGPEKYVEHVKEILENQ